MPSIPAEKFNITPSASAPFNTLALGNAIAAIDSGDTIHFRPEVYRLGEFVAARRGNFTLEGEQGTAFEYVSRYAGGAVEGGQAFLFGHVGEASEPQLENITLKRFTVRDLNKTDHPTAGDVGHLSASIELIGVENAVLDTITFEGSRGNSAVNVLGRGKNNYETNTKLFTAKDCTFTGEHQGDAINVGAVETVILSGNALPAGGVRRHFFEGGTATQAVVLKNNTVNMNYQGFCGWGSPTVLSHAVLSGNKWLNWSEQGAALMLAPDAPSWTGGDILPINGLAVLRDTFRSDSGIFAVGYLVPDVDDHVFRLCTFDCLLPFYFAQKPKGRVTIRENTPRPGLARLIAAPADIQLDTDWPIN